MQLNYFEKHSASFVNCPRRLSRKARQLLAVLSLTTCSIVAQRAVYADELVLGTGEIRLDGKVRLVDASKKLLVIDALSFSLPNGKSSSFPTAKTKNLTITATSKLHVRGNEGQILTPVDIRAGASVAVVGKDAGSGKDLPAREIVVWDRQENGQYFYGTVAAPVAPASARQVAPAVEPVRPNKVQPVAAPEEPQTPGNAIALDVTQSPILQIRVKIRSPNAVTPQLNLAPGVALPAALANLNRIPHLFQVALTTPQEAPEGAAGTISFPEGLGRSTNPTTLRVTAPRGLPTGGMMRPLPVQMYWGTGTTIPQGQPSDSEINALYFGYIAHGTRPPETYDGAGAVAIPVAPLRPEGADPVAPVNATTAVGEYDLQTTYAGNVHFQIEAAQDFLEPIQVNIPAETPDFSKPVTLTWEKLPRAIGYRVRAIGTRKPDGTRTNGALWTSSRVAPKDVQDEHVFDDSARAVKDGLLLDANTTSVTIPAGALTGMPSATFIVEAFGSVRVIKGSPAVRIVPVSEKVFVLPFVPDDGNGTGGTPRPNGRPTRVPLQTTPMPPTQIINGPLATVRIRTGVYDRRAFGAAAPSLETINEENNPGRTMKLTLAANVPPREDATATLSVPTKLLTGSNLPSAEIVPLKISAQSPIRAGGTKTEVKIYAGSGDKIAEGQPQTVTANYEEFMRLDSTSRATRFEADSLAEGPFSVEGESLRPQHLGPDASAVGAYSLKTSYAGNLDFTISPDQEFMKPIQLAIDSPAKDLTQPIKLSWQPIPGALGYHIYVSGIRNFNTKEAERFLWTPAHAIPTDVWPLILPTDIGQSIKDGVILGPDVTSVVLPAGMLVNVKTVNIAMQAFGPQQSITATPTSPELKIATTSDLTVKVDMP